MKPQKLSIILIIQDQRFRRTKDLFRVKLSPGIKPEQIYSKKKYKAGSIVKKKV